MSVMWNFDYSVRFLDHSKHRVVVEESSVTGAVWLFSGLALLVLILELTGLKPGHTIQGQLARAILPCAFFMLLALYASVKSTYTADWHNKQLAVERRFLSRVFCKTYDAHTIERVYVRTQRGGSALFLRFTSNKTKRLSWSYGAFHLEPFAAALTTVLYTPHGK